MNSGLYIIEGGGFSVSGNASVSGSGRDDLQRRQQVSQLRGGTYGSITLSGNGSYNLSPPTTGTYAGILIFQSRDNTKALTFSGNASGMTGTIYAPAAQLAESGNAQLNAALVVDTLTISGNGIANTVTLELHPPGRSLTPRPRSAPPTASTTWRWTAPARPSPSSMPTTTRASTRPSTPSTPSSG